MLLLQIRIVNTEFQGSHSNCYVHLSPMFCPFAPPTSKSVFSVFVCLFVFSLHLSISCPGTFAFSRERIIRAFFDTISGVVLPSHQHNDQLSTLTLKRSTHSNTFTKKGWWALDLLQTGPTVLCLKWRIKK